MTDSTVLDDHVGHAEDEETVHDTASLRDQRWSVALLVVRDLAIVLAATLIPLIFVNRLWEGSLRDPFTYFGDSHFYGMVARNIIENGWYQHTDRLGAPLGQQLYDFPLEGDNFWYFVMRLLSLFTNDWVLVINLFYLLSFFLASVSAFFSLRWLGVRRVSATVAAVLFAFAPYHFLRGVSHLTYSAYAIVPVGVVFAVRVARGEHPLSGIRDERRRRWGAVAGWLVLAALLGSCNVYFAGFSILMIVTAAFVTAAARRTWRPIVAGAVSVVIIGGVLGVNLLPSLLYSREHGKNTEVAHRQAAEVDVYGLRVIQLLTPIPDHRVEPLARLSNDLQQTPYNSEQSMFLGLVGSIGLLAMIGALLVRVARPGTPRDDRGGTGDDVRPLFGVLTIVIILVATMGGLSWFLAVAGFTELRGWNRISIVVAFLALAWLALSVDRLLGRRSYGSGGRALLVGVGVVVIVLGIADQTSKQIVPDRRTYQAEFHADRAYFGAIEDRLPRNAAVFQLPYIPFPEAGPVQNIVEYDPLRPYLNTKHLRWSYGGMKGRDSDWQAVAATEPAAEIVQDAIATGFSGVLVDRNGYQDKAASLTTELAQITGDPGFASADDRWVYFDLAAPTAQYKQSTTPAQRAAAPSGGSCRATVNSPLKACVSRGARS